MCTHVHVHVHVHVHLRVRVRVCARVRVRVHVLMCLLQCMPGGLNRLARERVTASGALPSASLASFIAAKLAPHVPVTARSSSRHGHSAASSSGSVNSISHSSSSRFKLETPQVTVSTSAEWLDDAGVDTPVPTASVIVSRGNCDERRQAVCRTSGLVLQPATLAAVNSVVATDRSRADIGVYVHEATQVP